MTVTEPLVARSPVGGFEAIDGLEWYRIDGADRLDPFLVNVVTASDQWMFVSSSGALTAGRRSAEHALFPYETDDRLHRSGGLVGPVTMIRSGDTVWEPFAPHAARTGIVRSIAKTAAGDRLRFEEHHRSFGLTFRYTWATSDRFGFVRQCELVRTGDGPLDVEIVDGLLDVLPAGVDRETQLGASTLVDAYRRSELDAGSGIAVFTLEALVSDQPEPAESLRATVVWSAGLADPAVALSDRQLADIRDGASLRPEHRVQGRKGAYLVSSSVTVAPDTPVRWSMVADVERDHAALADLRTWLAATKDPAGAIAASVDEAHDALVGIVAVADGLQETADRHASVHHFANVLFNVMRGGVFLDDHRVRIADVARAVARRNTVAAERFASLVAGLPGVVEIDDLRGAVAGDAVLERLVAEYLPLSFSRRHGDPSRPWNTFRISVRTDDGELTTGYEGNWRDIFQNWDALLHSFPGYLDSVVSKFLNASTIDGHNPYRITDEGIDWEMPEEGQWANLGYWGDHQIAYLSRLLDAERRFHPGGLEERLGRVRYSYADVPYRIVSYDRIVEDPKHTIEFDDERQRVVEERVARLGADGRLVPSGEGVHHASLAEKLFVPALAKLSNFVAGGGIWMNTQRPEWNDANNALVGHGVSMVTLEYLRQYLVLIDGVLERSGVETVPFGRRVGAWMDAVEAAFDDHRDLLEDLTDARRRSLLDALGEAFSAYRAEAYDEGPGEGVELPLERLRRFVAAVTPFLDATVAGSLRADGLAESYVLLHLEPGVARLETLPPMLEGQVAALSDPAMTAERSMHIVDTLADGPLYRADQRAFLLYPDRDLPPFREKNVVPDAALGEGARSVLDAEGDVLYRDAEGVVRFDADFRSARDLRDALDALEPGLEEGPRRELLDLYERVFRHAAFTGRSGAMYKYEGLGSIYWHMVSKLLFALQERVVAAVDAGEDPAVVAELARRYRRVRSGLGFVKTVAEQGTFPTDPHSHTPAASGAQQPGMTGQVKEGVLLRWGELGVRVEDGRIRFRPVVLGAEEFHASPTPWPVLGSQEVLDEGTLGFTYCGVPVVYRRDDDAWARVRWADGRETEGGNRLDAETSRAVFARTGSVARIDVGVPDGTLVPS
ncbi:MAG: hypothetical protein R3290_02090 [Acidimicrobiia bacterium]|nr:hypothetical protein [Acidimicrobiia bacterium]